ncbi:WNK lysine deficient protein kinase [Entomortierella parvispora]|uniref:non-specific serine/threonine protein kinase n=1 Tax=Entomortierella parvispora TaxID=205924 RepID=A0A9P3LUD7_9FUNG|nr:WNK lysine deficient protein kinase [Entomortierella parvispora]
MQTPADQSNETDGEAPLESDPTNRFQRCDEVLGEGAYKHVYRAFDQEEGVEVAWNQLRIDHLSKKEAQKILSEIEILQSIRNEHIINFYASWSTKAPNGGERIVFVTELMSSGTLKQYLKKTLKGPLKPKVLKSWCRQILQGLVYLHTHDPPIIHRDLKCDNIFINGNNGQLKIGDLGLAVVRHKTHVSSVLGTPEFMAPELYDEKYDEKVDIYAFGMCVLEMVTKEYPYSECTNQAQIYRKVTMGIKPKSLEHVQDLETREFINRCLDHDDRTRPSAQELLDSDFLVPCAAAPMLASTSMGLFSNPNRSLSEGIESLETPSSASFASNSNRSSFAEPSATSPTSGFPVSTPLSNVLPRIPPTSPVAKVQPITIPPTAFTTLTTVDADNKTYHIRSNLLPQTPTSADRTVVGSTPEADQLEDSSPTAESMNDPASEPPTLHSHANSKTCSIQVVQYGEANGDHLNLKMICTCPVAGPRDAALASGTHEIKFPFDLNVDTVGEVVAEMIREQILSADDREEATAKIQDLIDGVLAARKEQARITKDKARSLKSQLKVPPVDDLYQYGTSPTESYYDHYSTVGSNASAEWNGDESLVESDQGYGTVPPRPPQQPPVISEATFPPLHAAPQSKVGSKVPSEKTSHDQHTQLEQPQSQHELRTTVQQQQQQHQVSYSEVVQHPVTGQLSNSPRRPRSPATSRPQSFYGVESKSQSSTAKNGLRDIETTTLADRKRNEELEDVGYTSPYRHGVSSSSINYHRRSPSVDASVIIAQPTPRPSQATGLSPDQTGILSKPQSTAEHHRVSYAPVRFPSTNSETAPTLSRESSLRKSIPVTNGSTLPSESLELHPSSGVSTLNGGVERASRPPVLSTLSTQLKNLELRTSHSASSLPLHHEGQHPHQHTHVIQQKPVASGLLSSNTGVLGKKDIELWSNNVPTGDSMSAGTFANGSTYSSCPETSDDEEVLDEDLKVLREKQRQELELMRLQHVQQWEMMMKLKEQKGQQERIRRKSEVGAAPPHASSLFQ